MELNSRSRMSAEVIGNSAVPINRTSTPINALGGKSVAGAGDGSMHEAVVYYDVLTETSEFEEAIVNEIDIVRQYKRFKAARTIQTAMRRWYTRRLFLKKKLAAIVIQKWWRRFFAQRYYFKLLENTVQERAMKHYNDAATRIQALWRGWWVRRHIHDHSRFCNMRLLAAEDLLYCVGFKLHHLLRTEQIPGIYSHRNKKCLSKVEQLLASMSFKHHNKRARQLRSAREEAERERALKEGSTGRHKCPPKVRTSGFKQSEICDPKCCEYYKGSKGEQKMFEILNNYRDTIDRNVCKKLKFGMSQNEAQLKQKQPDFCEYVIQSMRRWRILNTQSLRMDATLKNLPNVEAFLKEAEDIYNRIQYQSCCTTGPAPCS